MSDQPARFSCQFEGCKRTFSRQEHLQRHILNHAGDDFACERCRTVFKRPDLLERHMARHRQKDLEGGSLMTRKRLYKDEQGNVISKRPAKERRKPTESVSREVGTLPLSPPGSSSDPAVSPSRFENELYSAPTHQIEIITHPRPAQAAQQPQNTWSESFLDDSLAWNSSNLGSADLGYANGPFDDIFAPDTASSFNMPYTTANNYNWLFDLSFDHVLYNSDSAELISSRTNPPREPVEQYGMNPHSTRTNGMLPARMESSSTAMAAQFATEKRVNINHSDLDATFSVQVHDHEVNRNLLACDSSTNLRITKERPMAFMMQDYTLPLLDDSCYERLIDLIEQVNPSMPDGSLVSLENHLLAHSSLQSYLDLYFTSFNTAYPLIHMASFDVSSSQPLLLLSMILLGATYSDKDAHQIAVCVHDVLRPQIFAHSSFSAKPELWILQTILLTECLGKSRGGQRQHDMSHLFHGLLINLIRRSDCQSATPENTIDEKAGVNTQWKTWIDLEQKKRLAQLCFLWDVQHAVLFSQSLCMSAFELRSTLPCDQELWEAPTADEWQTLWRTQNHASPHLLSVLKAYLKPQKEAMIPKQLNALSRVLILHSLMSISWDMTRRDQTSLGMMGNSLSAGSWRDRMSKAYDAWKSDFDVFAQSLSKPQTTHGANGMEDTSRDFVIANKAIYHAAQLILNAEILDLQIYAGARHILGRPVSRVDYSRSQTAVKTWATKDSAKAAKATFHASHILRDAMSDTKDLIVVGNLFHHPWTICLAALTIWSFYHIMPKAPEMEEDEMIWGPKADMEELLETITNTLLDDLSRQSRERNCTAGMTAVVSNSLSMIRWGVVHDGMLVLKGLTPWRLINEDR